MESLFFHPKVVHLPIALGLLMPLVAGGLLVAWSREWLPRRAWIVAVVLQGVLLASGVAGLKSGEAQEERVEDIVGHRAIHEHEEAAEVFVGGGGVVFALMLVAAFLPEKKGALPLAALATLGTLAVLYLGYRVGQLGGELVYERGAASAYVETGGAPAAAEEDDDD